MPRVKKIWINNYRSIGSEGIQIAFPKDLPLVLIGENNAGKSNIIRALSLVLGEGWPGSHNPEDHEFFNRSPEGIEIKIIIEVEDMTCPKHIDSEVEYLEWTFEKDNDKPCKFVYKSKDCSCSWISNQLREQISWMTVGVDRTLAYQLSYSSKWTTLSKLMRRFHNKLIENEQRTEKLKEYYKSLTETFYEVEDFKYFADYLRESTEDFGANMGYGLKIDFSAYDPSNFFKSLHIIPNYQGEPRSYDEMGTGQEQVLAIAFSYSYAKAFGGQGLGLVIEEPEAHLHPLAQQWVSVKLYELAKQGVQVLITTHSPYFINLSYPENIVLVRKSGEGRATNSIQVNSDDLTRRVNELSISKKGISDTIGSFYENSATNDIKGGLFGRGCILVEGLTEYIALPEIFSILNYDLVKLGLTLIPVGGITNIPKWIRYFRTYQIPVYPVFDSDSDKHGKEASPLKEARKEIFASLEIEPNKDWDDLITGSNTPIGIHPKFAVFDSNFEAAIRSSFKNQYTQLEENARKELGNSKPLIARYVIRNLPKPEVENYGEWSFLKSLVTSIAEYFSKEICR